jgi:hypothetical protein
MGAGPDEGAHGDFDAQAKTRSVQVVGRPQHPRNAIASTSWAGSAARALGRPARAVSAV